MTSHSALSRLASDAPLDDARSFPNDASVASRKNAFIEPRPLKTPFAVFAENARQVDASAPNAGETDDGARSPGDANGASSPAAVKADFVDDAGKIDWNAALSANENWLRSTIATQVGENAAVDEVFQDVALAATRQKAPIRDPRKVGAWLRRLATVYSLLYRRSLGRKKKLLQRYQDRIPVRETSADDAEPLHWLLTEERRALVREATALLADDERRVLTLKYAEDRSYKEIAEEIGATVSAVQSKLHRARARLREKLAELAPTTVAPPA